MSTMLCYRPGRRDPLMSLCVCSGALLLCADASHIQPQIYVLHILFAWSAPHTLACAENSRTFSTGTVLQSSRRLCPTWHGKQGDPGERH